MNQNIAGHLEGFQEPIEQTVSLNPDILKILEETREGAMEELEEVGNYEEELKNKCKAELLLRMSQAINSINPSLPDCIALAEKIVETGDLNLRMPNNKDGKCMLGILLLLRKNDLAYALIDAGANPDVYHKGMKLLEIAYHQNLGENVIKELINRGSNPNMVLEDGGMSLLHTYSLMGKSEMVSFLAHRPDIDLDKKIDRFTGNKDNGLFGLNSLMIAAREGSPNIVQILLDAGANPNITVNDTGKNAYDIAKGRGYDVVANMIHDNPSFIREKHGVIDSILNYFKRK